MLQFKDITLDAKKIIESYTKAWSCENAEFSFAHLYMWNNNSSIQYAEENNVLYVKFDFPNEDTFTWAPIPKYRNSDYKKAVETAFHYLHSIGEKPSFRSVTSPFYEMLLHCDTELTFTPAPWNYDYIYSSEDLIQLKGKKYHGKRNHIKKLETLYPDYEYEDLTSSMLEECMELYQDWREKHNDPTIKQYNEPASVEKAIRNLKALNLTGGVIRIDGKMKAFTVGEQILPNMYQIHIEKAADDIDGLYPLINREYAAHHCSGIEFINREEDMGLEGLRKAKRSYKPVRMLEKYNVDCCSVKCRQLLEEREPVLV